jgi:hypothetical protein
MVGGEFPNDFFIHPKVLMNKDMPQSNESGPARCRVGALSFRAGGCELLRRYSEDFAQWRRTRLRRLERFALDEALNFVASLRDIQQK